MTSIPQILFRHHGLSRVTTDENHDLDGSSGGTPNRRSSSSGPPGETALPESLAERGEGGDRPDDVAPANASPSATETENGNGGDGNEEGNNASDSESDGSLVLSHRRLVELQEERELRRRRQSTCTLLVIFILFRLWMEALAEGSPPLLIICLIATSWTVRWIRFRREREDEIDRNIEEHVRQGRIPELRTPTGGDGSAAEADLSLMSFQAQLALAIIESQRQMMDTGGYGHPDGENSETRGVSEEARSRWVRYDFRPKDPSEVVKPSPDTKKRRRKKGGGVYGSVSSVDSDKNNSQRNVPPSPASESSPKEGLVDRPDADFEPIDDLALDEEDAVLGADATCSICLCEYEDGERIARLPCGHFYHDDCVSAWCSNHIRCPLCNFDLEEGLLDQSQPTPTTTPETASSTSPTSSGLPLATMV